MTNLLSITDFAKLCRVSTETLRHYDRIGLLKPTQLQESNRERYYAITQHEQVGTIKELQQLGFTLKEIGAYFDNRTVETTQDLLRKSQAVVTERIRELTHLQEAIRGKLDFLDSLPQLGQEGQLVIKDIPEDRTYLRSQEAVADEDELSYAAIGLEKQIYQTESYLPIFASNRYAGFYDKHSLETAPHLGIQVHEGIPNQKMLVTVPKGCYASLIFQGDFWQGKHYLQVFLDQAKSQGLNLAPQILQVQWLDYTFVTQKDQLVFELQARILE